MSHKFKYTELIEQNSINFKKLPQEIASDIKKSINQMKIVNMRQGQQKDVSSIMAKINALDEQICQKINKWIEEGGNKEPLTEKEGAKKTPPATPPANSKTKESDDKEKGTAVNTEIEACFKSGKTELSVDELKSLMPACYQIIFDSYEPEGKNGIETPFYSLIETSKEKFTISKL